MTTLSVIMTSDSTRMFKLLRLHTINKIEIASSISNFRVHFSVSQGRLRDTYQVTRLQNTTVGHIFWWKKSQVFTSIFVNLKKMKKLYESKGLFVLIINNKNVVFYLWNWSVLFWLPQIWCNGVLYCQHHYEDIIHVLILNQHWISSFINESCGFKRQVRYRVPLQGYSM